RGCQSATPGWNSRTLSALFIFCKSSQKFVAFRLLVQNPRSANLLTTTSQPPVLYLRDIFRARRRLPGTSSDCLHLFVSSGFLPAKRSAGWEFAVVVRRSSFQGSD